MEDAVRPPTARRKLVWAGAIAALSAGALASAEVHGRSSRLPFQPPAGLRERPVAMAGSAADAFGIWRAAGIRGRRVVVLTGQWSKPTRNAKARPPAPDEVAAPAGGDLDLVDAGNALYVSARLGIVRRLDVVMPPSAFTHRLGEVSGRKELLRADGAFRLAFEGLERRFSTPRAFVAPPEKVLVLVEPSWFAEGAPPDPLGWLSSSGTAWDLALVALEDPAATAAERQAALSYARALGAPFLETAE